jgi:hypothetical protein
MIWQSVCIEGIGCKCHFTYATDEGEIVKNPRKMRTNLKTNYNLPNIQITELLSSVKLDKLETFCISNKPKLANVTLFNYNKRPNGVYYKVTDPRKSRRSLNLNLKMGYQIKRNGPIIFPAVDGN